MESPAGRRERKTTRDRHTASVSWCPHDRRRSLCIAMTGHGDYRVSGPAHRRESWRSQRRRCSRPPAWRKFLSPAIRRFARSLSGLSHRSRWRPY